MQVTHRDFASDAAAIAVDPVCEMEVRVVHDTPQAEHAGGTYYFCNQGCRDAFAQSPESYLKS